MKNRTRQIASYPNILLSSLLYLRRRITDNMDDLIMNADTLNAILVELERMEKVLGVENESLNNTGLIFNGHFGDGSDGDRIVSSDTVLTRDVYYRNLTVNNGANLRTNGYRMFVKDTLTIEEGSYVHNNGGDGIDDQPGAGTPPSVLGRGVAGGAGGATNGTSAALPTLFSQAGSGGDGGDTAFGTGGSGTTNNPLDYYGPRDIFSITTLETSNTVLPFHEGGGGGGGGAGDDTVIPNNIGGGGGGGAGVLMVAAYRIRFFYNPSILFPEHPFQAKGGNGGGGLSPTGTGQLGSGGGGGGGYAAVMSHVIENLYDDTIEVPLQTGVSGPLINASGGTTFGLLPGDPGDDGIAVDMRI